MATKKSTSKTQSTNEVEKEYPNFFLCTRCGKKIKKLKDFPSGKSEIYEGYEYRLPICSDCLEKLYDKYFDKYAEEYEEEDDEIVEGKAIRRVCMMYNLYYSDTMLQSAIKSNKDSSLIKSYIKQINLWQYRNKSFDNTLEEEREKEKKIIITSENVEETIENEDGKQITSETIKFFGAGLGSAEDYIYLQEQYDEWIHCYECKTKSQEEIFKRLSFNQWETWKAKMAGEDTKELDKTFKELLDIAKIQPKQNSSDAFSQAQTFGTLIDKWENTRPLPEIDEELRDVDKIGTMITVWFKGHLSKMLNLKNSFSKLYEEYKEKYTVTRPTYEEDEESDYTLQDIFDED